MAKPKGVHPSLPGGLILQPSDLGMNLVLFSGTRLGQDMGLPCCHLWSQLYETIISGQELVDSEGCGCTGEALLLAPPAP